MARYKTWEVFKMLTENPKLEFGMIVGGVRINKTLSILDTPVGKRYFLEPGEYTGFVYTDTEWELVRKPVAFMEAVKALENGKRIISKSGTIEHEYSWKDGILLDESENPVTINEILYFGWYIEEDEI